MEGITWRWSLRSKKQSCHSMGMDTGHVTHWAPGTKPSRGDHPWPPSSLCPGHSLLIVEYEGLRLAGLDNVLASQCPGHQDRGSASLPSVRAVNIVPDTALGPWKQQRNPQRSLSSWHGDQRRKIDNKQQI